MSDTSLNTAADQIGHHWMEVGYNLDFTKAQLETIEHDNTSLIDKNTNMLIQWRQRQDVSVDQMLNTLHSTFQKCGFEVESDQTIEKEKDQVTAPDQTTKVIPNLKDTEWDHDKKYTEEEKRRLLEACIMRIIVAGTFENGKSSLARSLLGKSSSMAASNDRTMVVDFKRWQVDENTIVTLYDLGGHDCYQAIAHLFFVNAKNNVAIIAHKIVSDDYAGTYKWLTDVLTHAPRCVILLALTMVDLAETPQQLKHLRDKFRNKMLDHLTSDLELLQEKLKPQGQSDVVQKTSDLELLQEKLKHQAQSDIVQKMEKVKNDLQYDTNIYSLSCDPSYNRDGLNILEKDLFNMLTDKQFKQWISKDSLLLYTDIGVLGKEMAEQEHIKSIEVEAVEDNFVEEVEVISQQIRLQDEVTTDIKLPVKAVAEVPKEVTSEIISSIKIQTTKPDMSELRSSASQEALKQIQEPSNIIKPLKFITKSQIREKFENRLTDKSSKEKTNMALNKSLGEIHALGLIQWYGTSDPKTPEPKSQEPKTPDPNTPDLEQYIFNDTISFIDMLKCIFNHNVQGSLEELENKSPQMKKMIDDLGRTKYNKDLNTLCNQGMLSRKLLQILCSQFGFQKHVVVFQQLLQHLNLIHPIAETEWLFFPHYVDQVKIPSDIENRLEDLDKKYDEGHFTLHGQIEGNIPSSLLNMLCVGIHKHKLLVGGMPDQIRRFWKNNLFATVGGNTHLHLRYIKGNSKISKIDVRIKCKRSVRCLRKAWEIIRLTSEEAKHLNTKWWPGQINDITLSCPHCCVRGLSCEQWPLVDVLKKTCQPEENIYCLKYPNEDPFPGALLYPLPEDKDADECLKELSDYIKTNCNVLDPQREPTQETPEMDITVKPIDTNNLVVKRLLADMHDIEKVECITAECQTQTEVSDKSSETEVTSSSGITVAVISDGLDQDNCKNSDAEEFEPTGAQGYEVCTRSEPEQTVALVMHQMTDLLQNQQVMAMQNRALSLQIEKTDKERKQEVAELFKQNQIISHQMTHENRALAMQSQQQHYDIKTQMTTEHFAMSQQTTAHSQVILEEVDKKGQVIVEQAATGATISSVETELQQIVLSTHMGEAERASAWQGDDASCVVFHLTHPVFNKHQQALEANLQVNEEMLNKLYTFEVLEYNETAGIQSDRSEQGKVKRLLWIVEEKSVEDKFILALNECSGPNKAMGEILLTAMDDAEVVKNIF